MNRCLPIPAMSCGLLLAAVKARAPTVDEAVDSQAMPWLVSSTPGFACGIGDGTGPTTAFATFRRRPRGV